MLGPGYEEPDEADDYECVSSDSSSDSNDGKATSKQMRRPADSSSSLLCGPFGQLTSDPVQGPDWTWSVKDESKVYSDKTLQTINFRERIGRLPTTIIEYETFRNTVGALFATLDKSTEGYLVYFWECTGHLVGKAETHYSYFHQDSQGLILFDRWLGGQMTTRAFLDNEQYGQQIRSYCTYCRSRREIPKGRVIAAIMTIRFRIDVQRGNVTHMLAFFDIPPPGLRDGCL